MKNILIYCLILCVAWQLVNTAFTALHEAVVNDDFPETLAVKLEALPIIFPIHMITGGLALLLAPLSYLLRKHKRWHKPVGMLTALDIAISAFTAYPVAWVAPVTWVSGAGFMTQATLWLLCLGLGLWAIYTKRPQLHRRAMLMVIATTLGAEFFRIFLYLGWRTLNWQYGNMRVYSIFYSLDAWLAWLFPVSLTAAWLWRKRGRNVSREHSS